MPGLVTSSKLYAGHGRQYGRGPLYHALTSPLQHFTSASPLHPALLVVRTSLCTKIHSDFSDLSRTEISALFPGFKDLFG